MVLLLFSFLMFGCWLRGVLPSSQWRLELPLEQHANTVFLTYQMLFGLTQNSLRLFAPEPWRKAFFPFRPFEFLAAGLEVEQW